MLMLISPAKKLNAHTSSHTQLYSEAAFLADSQQLVDVLRTYSLPALSQLMKISDPLARLNAGRFRDWKRPFTPNNAKPAVLMFQGDVYEGLNAAHLHDDQLNYLQRHLRILSGLYGVLRPLDLIQAYRLEMGTRLCNPRGKDLYAFWGGTITGALNQVLAEQTEPVLVNLASAEYYKAVQPQQLRADVITPVFQDYSKGGYKIISFYAKRARGLMVRWAAEHQVTQPAQLKDFDSEGYAYVAAASEERSWVFRRN